MRNLVGTPCRARIGYRCALARAVCTLAVAGGLACLPVRDLSGYAGADAEPGGNPASSPKPSGMGDGGALLPGGSQSSGDGIPGPDVTLLPSASAAPSRPAPTLGEGSATDAGAPPTAGDAGSSPPDAATDAPVPAVCALDESTGPNGRCYLVVDPPLSWDAARTNCQSRGAGWDLTSIRSEADSRFVRWLIAGEVWVGGSDAVTEGTWTWVNDGLGFWQGDGATGQPLNAAFVNWFNDEPNGTDTSDCLRLLIDATWADLECAEPRPSVCEGPVG